ncbi:unnamed protein product [Nippostrongylus brasiliensis]|uniref:CCHC-type domain-containing protein n=1 Tax=Nippostrongylus brasiliensis TaxID=27835 RepID=A0A0N4YMX1_NIPBR|nr:unnamed protein product [Nippostrongylus brasiliensis]
MSTIEDQQLEPEPQDVKPSVQIEEAPIVVVDLPKPLPKIPKVRPSSPKVVALDTIAEKLSAIHSLVNRTEIRANRQQRMIQFLSLNVDEIKKKIYEFCSQEDQQSTSSNQNRGLKRARSPSPAGTNSSQQSTKGTGFTCVFCDDDHYSCHCTKYIQLPDRERRILKKGKCERCLRKADHLSTSCASKHTCIYYCKSARREAEMLTHNSALCYFIFNM